MRQRREIRWVCACLCRRYTGSSTCRVQVIRGREVLCSKPFIPRTHKGRGIFLTLTLFQEPRAQGTFTLFTICGSEHLPNALVSVLPSVSCCPSLGALTSPHQPRSPSPGPRRALPPGPLHLLVLCPECSGPETPEPPPSAAIQMPPFLGDPPSHTARLLPWL